MAIAAIQGRSLRITRIRAGRTPPGLKKQHLTGVLLVNQLTHGVIQGAEVCCIR